jgi:AcrR family transcriptional regulator
MGITERKERERGEMRDLILQGAQKLFLENGYEKTSIRAIADAIEYSPATIYLYYKDKNELLLALHVIAFQKMMQEFSVVATLGDPFERLEALGQQYMKFAIENPELYDLMFIMQAPMEALACKNAVWEDGLKSFGFLEMVISDCIAGGYFKADRNVQDTALMVWSFVHGLVTVYLKKRMDMFDDNREIEHMQRSFKLFIEIIKKAL